MPYNYYTSYDIRSVVVDSLFIVAALYVCLWFLLCYAVLIVISNFAIISLR